jgi:hypothetical protein
MVYFIDNGCVQTKKKGELVRDIGAIRQVLTRACRKPGTMFTPKKQSVKPEDAFENTVFDR